jgi:hypothetical protein
MFSNHALSIPLGIIAGLLASFVQSLGLTIQRKSHVLNQALPEHRQRVEHRRPLVSLISPLAFGLPTFQVMAYRVCHIHFLQYPRITCPNRLSSSRYSRSIGCRVPLVERFLCSLHTGRCFLTMDDSGHHPYCRRCHLNSILWHCTRIYTVS